MTLFTRSLWPDSVHSPYRRLVAGVSIGAVVVAALLTLMAFVLAGMSEPTADAVVAVTIDAGIALSVLVLAFALTFGLLGIGLLWSLAQRAAVVWLTTGLAAGGLGGLVFSVFAMNELPHVLLAVSAAAGMVFFLVVRLVAGIQGDKRPG